MPDKPIEEVVGITGLGPLMRSQRGFHFVDFNDTYGLQCRMGQSSADSRGYIWLGQAGHCMHLNRAQVERVVVNLQQWLQTGNFQ